MATAQATASAALAKPSIKPSPVLLISAPLCAASTLRSVSKCAWRSVSYVS
jgi:hypothetical protein